MADPANTPATEEKPDGIVLSDAEQASVEAAKRGLTEPEGVNTPVPVGPQRPDWCPEQFFKDGKVDTEGLAKSYGELRTKMDAAPKPEDAPNPDDAAPATDAAGKIKAAEGDAPAGDDQPSPLTQAMDTARTEWAEAGEVSEDTVAALEAAGIPRDVFALYIEGVKAQTAASVAAIHNAAGGEDAYNAATAWAAKNLKADEIATFNDALDNPALRETAVAGLMARYAKAVPSEGRQVTPTDTPGAGADVFTSRDELVAAQKDPRYQTDAKYRDEVVAKLARSQKGGFEAFPRPMFANGVFSRG